MNGDPLPLIDQASWPPEIAHLRDGPLGQLNVYRAMANHPALLTAWASLRDHLVVRSTLTPQQSEIVILRTGRHWGSRYEWMHHVSRGRRVGLDDDAIARCAAQEVSAADGDMVVAVAVDALMTQGRLDGDLLAQVTHLVGTTGVLDIMATVGFYSTLAFLLETFAVPVDADILAELGDDPLANAPVPKDG